MKNKLDSLPITNKDKWKTLRSSHSSGFALNIKDEVFYILGGNCYTIHYYCGGFGSGGGFPIEGIANDGTSIEGISIMWEGNVFDLSYDDNYILSHEN